MTISVKIRAAALAAGSSLALSGCLLSPGSFMSELHLMKDGTFSYSYDGRLMVSNFAAKIQRVAKAASDVIN